MYAPTHTWLKKMYNKQFWETFIEKNGNKFDPSENKLFYLYSESFDMEEEKVEIEIFSENILEVKAYQLFEEEPKSNNIDFRYVKMDTINSINFNINI